MISTWCLQLFDRQPELARQLRHLVVVQQPQVLADDLLRRRAFEVQVLDLQREAFLEVARRDADRIEALDQAQRLFDLLDRPRPHRGDLVHRRDQVAVVIEVADDGFADFADGVVGGLQRELPFEVIGQRRAGRERVLDRRQLFDFLRRARAIAVVEVVAEEVLVVGVVPRSRSCPWACPRRLLSRAWVSAACSSSVGTSSSSGFSTTSWLRRSASSNVDIGRSLIACCSDGVRISFCASFV